MQLTRRGFSALPLMAAASTSGVSAQTTSPVVLELFQSQGCSSCPPTNAIVNALADREDLICLMYSITYWDNLGWPDTFAKPDFTQRQRDYAQGIGTGVYTPQVVLNGRTDLVGNNARELESAIAQVRRTPARANITQSESGLRIEPIGSGSTHADIWFVEYDSRTLDVPILRGENGGRTLPHRHIVRSLRRIGAWNGTASDVATPTISNELYKGVMLVQSVRGGPILGAQHI